MMYRFADASWSEDERRSARQGKEDRERMVLRSSESGRIFRIGPEYNIEARQFHFEIRFVLDIVRCPVPRKLLLHGPGYTRNVRLGHPYRRRRDFPGHTIDFSFSFLPFYPFYSLAQAFVIIRDIHPRKLGLPVDYLAGDVHLLERPVAGKFLFHRPSYLGNVRLGHLDRMRWDYWSHIIGFTLVPLELI